MGKQKKKRNKKYRPTYTTDGRVDMRTGGRVKAQVGGIPQPTVKDRTVTSPGMRGNVFDPPDDDDNGGKKDPPNNPPQTPLVQGEGQAFNAGRGTISSEDRRERIARTAAETEARAAGEVPEAAISGDAEQVGFQRDAVVKANLEEIRNLTEPAKFAKI